ncbi:hypothetical protein G7Z17_g10927 [Cylindrodendrum hubeiense]|uniref:Adhesin domain-containing protein n=1 Tax=Cylindrodendrum hubeiense TaxID=595255 RepID=A0A9P5H1R8_9HYPO|nr:hypothetical protein G7Z17_g10927 [Cylindrodendrum hubeiense]
MPSPYSDNLYSAVDSSGDEADALSPTDGYFHASSDPASSSSHPQGPYHRSAASVPRVPNVFVEDPNFQDPGAKVREAEAERALLNRGEAGAQDPAMSPRSGSARYQPSSISTSPPSHYNQQSVEQEHNPYTSLDHRVATSYMGHHPPSVATNLVPHHRDAPPAYTPSPTSPPSSGYQTFAPSNSTMGLPEEQQRLIARGPESMGGPPSSPPPPSPPRWQRIKSSVTSIDLRRKLKTTLGVLIIFSVVFIMFSSFMLGPSHKKPDINDNEPVKKPDMDQTDLVWNPTRGCLNHNLKHFKSTVSLDVRYNRNLTIIQKSRDDEEPVSGWTPRISGEIVLRPTDRASPGTIELEIIINDDRINLRDEFNKNEQEFQLLTPRKVPWDSDRDGGPCIQIRATVWVPREAVLNGLKVDTVHLDVAIKEGLILGALDPAIIRTVVGDVKTPGPKDDKTTGGEGVVPYTLATREIHISTTSGDVRGWYPLYDVLDLKTSSGDVAVHVGTKPVDPQGVRPALLRVHSVSGQVSVQEPLDSATSAARPDKKFPPRDYIVDVATVSGDITVDVAASSLAEFGSQSGDLKLRLWPVLDSGLLKGDAPEKPVVKTDTKSGDTHVAILEPLWTSLATIGEAIPPSAPEDLLNDNEPYIIPVPKSSKKGDGFDDFVIADTPSFSCLTSKHSSISGKIKLEYPSSWEGTLRATTISGKQTVRGEGLETHDESSKPWSKRLRGSKGTGHSRLDIDSVSGDEDVLIGKDIGSKVE